MWGVLGWVLVISLRLWTECEEVMNNRLLDLVIPYRVWVVRRLAGRGVELRTPLTVCPVLVLVTS